MKKIVLYVIGSLTLALVTFLAVTNSGVEKQLQEELSTAIIVEDHLNEKALLDDTDLVIVGKVVSSSKILLYKETNFQTFDVEIFECLNTKDSRKKITVIQTVFEGNSEFIPLKEGNMYILFLLNSDEGVKAGPDYYWIAGVSFGQVDLGKIDKKATKTATVTKLNSLQDGLATSKSSIMFSVEKLIEYYDKKEMINEKDN